MPDLTRRSLIGHAAVAAGAAPAAIAAQPSAPLFGPATGEAHLVFNENPYGPAPSALRAMAEAARAGCYYADDVAPRLAERIAARFRVAPEQVVLGNGSFELLVAAAAEWGRTGAIVQPELMFDEPLARAEHRGVRRILAPLAPDMQVDLAAMAARIGPDVAMIYLCNPNNPTGLLLRPAALRDFIRSVPPRVTVLVDEAYMELADSPGTASMIDLVREGRNVIVTRTFSKLYGMAGLRVGYAIAGREPARRIAAACGTIGVNSAGLAAALGCYDDLAFARFSLAQIRDGRTMILSSARRAGLRTLPSATNFVFVEVPDADRLRDRMAERGIRIRGAYGRWNRWSRVSCGRIDHVRRYAEALPALSRA